MKKWILVFAGFGAGIAVAACVFQLEKRPTEGTFIEAPLVWMTTSLQRSIPSLRKVEFGSLFVLLWFLYWPCLGALLGGLVKFSGCMFHRLRCHDALPRSAEQTTDAKDH